MIGSENGQEIWDRDEKRLNSLKEKHPVKVVWECEVKRELLIDPEMAEFFDNYEPIVSYITINP